MYLAIERFQSRGQHVGKFVGTNESVDIRKKFDFYTIGLEYQHGRRFIVRGTNMAAVTSYERAL